LEFELINFGLEIDHVHICNLAVNFSFYKWADISSSFKDCIEDIIIQMNSSMLKLNKDKIEFIVFSSK